MEIVLQIVESSRVELAPSELESIEVELQVDSRVDSKIGEYLSSENLCT